MRIIIGIIVFRSDLELLFKDLVMFSKQYLPPDRDIELGFFILDNDGGRQLQSIKDMVEKNFSSGIAGNISYVSSENVGFGAGHNKIFSLAKQEADFDYYICVNPDGIPHREMLGRMVSFAEKNNDRGIFEARQFPAEHPKVYDPVTGITAWCSGCCLMFPKKVFEELKGFDELFFMYMEDVDISWRARLIGYGCYTVPEALFSHVVNAKERDSDFEARQMSISGYKIALKYGNRKFQGFCLDRLRGFLDERAIKNIELELTRGKDHHKYFAHKAFMDFEHEFHFSQARW